MGNEGLFKLHLLDMQGKAAHDPNTRVIVHRANGGTVRKFNKLKFPLTQWLKLPAFPQEHQLYCWIFPERYRHRSSEFFLLTDGEKETQTLRVMRKPNKWRARFTAWKNLQSKFNPLKKVLEKSADVKVKKGTFLGQFSGSEYDDDLPKKAVLGKAALLNLFAKLTDLNAPTTRRNWFWFVQEILVIDRERFMATVDLKMGEIIKNIRENIDKFESYKRAGAGLHDFPERFNVPKGKMMSIKSKESHGNIQLTVGPGKDPSTGSDLLLLDTDMDENGELIAHFGDLLKHKITGGTHPYDIHEYLVIENPKRSLGYVLV